MKSAKVNVWREAKNIGTSFNTSIYINPDIIETTELMLWNNKSGVAMGVEFKSGPVSK